MIMRHIHLVGGLALLSASASPALADWQYAHWGMSPAAVVAASGGQAKLARPDKSTNTVFGSTGAEASFSQPPFTFRVIFNFRYDKLTQVTLHPLGKVDCSPIAAALTTRFGPPVVKSLYTDITSFFWSDTPGANDIRVLRLAETCAVIYVQHGVVPARAPQGRARPDELKPGPSQTPAKSSDRKHHPD